MITPEGHSRLKVELEDLWRVRRPEVVRAKVPSANRNTMLPNR
nr:hypothetical protein [Xanthomonas vesicatoria]